MKRILMGMAWFLLLWLVADVVFGGIVGAMAIWHQSGHLSAYQTGYVLGQAVGTMLRQFGSRILLGALVLTIAGSITGLLPGTCRRKSKIA